MGRQAIFPSNTTVYCDKNKQFYGTSTYFSHRRKQPASPLQFYAEVIPRVDNA